MLRDTEQPYPIDLNVDYGATKLTLKGTVQDPFQWTGANADLTLSGPNLSEIYPLLGIPGPPTPPYRISGKLEREPGLWKFVNTKWHVGDSDLTGDILIDETKKPEFLTAKLVSQHWSSPTWRRWSARRRARPATCQRSRSRPSSSSKPPAICFPTCRSIPSA